MKYGNLQSVGALLSLHQNPIIDMFRKTKPGGNVKFQPTPGIAISHIRTETLDVKWPFLGSYTL
jgi:hypothetical protein